MHMHTGAALPSSTCFAAYLHAVVLCVYQLLVACLSHLSTIIHTYVYDGLWSMYICMSDTTPLTQPIIYLLYCPTLFLVFFSLAGFVQHIFEWDLFHQSSDSNWCPPIFHDCTILHTPVSAQKFIILFACFLHLVYIHAPTYPYDSFRSFLCMHARTHTVKFHFDVSIITQYIFTHKS